MWSLGQVDKHESSPPARLLPQRLPAGLVGLAVARALALSGHEVVLLDKERAYGTATSSRHSEGTELDWITGADRCSVGAELG